MTEALIVLTAVAAAVYLLAPLFRAKGRLLAVPLLLAAWGALAVPPAAAAEERRDLTIGLLLIAVDAQRDHLRVSEALRVVNPGLPRDVDLTMTLPAGAVHLTFHRGVRTAEAAPGGVRARVRLGRGVTEVIYSYAIPAGKIQTVTRRFPLRVQRMEIVAPGGRVKLSASRGQTAGEMTVGGASLVRWEIRALAAWDPFTFTLRGLPVSRRWFPPAAAGAFAAVLAAGLGATALARPRAARG